MESNWQDVLFATGSCLHGCSAIDEEERAQDGLIAEDRLVRLLAGRREGFQALIREAPDEVFVRAIEERAIRWHLGCLQRGLFLVFVPEGEQERRWSNLSEKISLCGRT